MAILLVRVEAAEEGRTEETVLDLKELRKEPQLLLHHVQQLAFDLLPDTAQMQATYLDDEGDKCTLTEQTCKDALSFAAAHEGIEDSVLLCISVRRVQEELKEKKLLDEACLDSATQAISKIDAAATSFVTSCDALCTSFVSAPSKDSAEEVAKAAECPAIDASTQSEMKCEPAEQDEPHVLPMEVLSQEPAPMEKAIESSPVIRRVFQRDDAKLKRLAMQGLPARGAQDEAEMPQETHQDKAQKAGADAVLRVELEREKDERLQHLCEVAGNTSQERRIVSDFEVEQNHTEQVSDVASVQRESREGKEMLSQNSRTANCKLQELRRKCCSELQDALSQEQQKCAATEAELSSERMKVQELHAGLLEQREVAGKAIQELEHERKQAEQVSDALQRRSCEASQLQEALSQAQQRCVAMEEELGSERSKVQEIQHDTKILSTRLSSDGEKIEHLEQKLVDAEDHAKQLQQELVEQRESSEKSLQELHAELLAQREAAEKAMQELEEKQAEQVLRSIMLEERAVAKSCEASQLQEALSQEQQKCLAIEEGLSSERSKVQDLEQKLGDADNHAKQLQQELAEQHESSEKALKEIHAELLEQRLMTTCQREAAEKVMQELEHEQKQAEQVSDALHRKSCEASQLQEALSQAQQRCLAIEEELSSERSKVQDMQHDAGILSTMLNSGGEKIGTLEQRLGDAENRAKQLQQELVEQQESSEQALKELDLRVKEGTNVQEEFRARAEKLQQELSQASKDSKEEAMHWKQQAQEAELKKQELYAEMLSANERAARAEALAHQMQKHKAAEPKYSASVHMLEDCPLTLGIEAQEERGARGDVTTQMLDLVQSFGARQAIRIGRVHLPAMAADSSPASGRLEVKNDGSLRWPQTTVIVHVDGEPFGLEVMALGCVEPGEVKTIEMDLEVQYTQSGQTPRIHRPRRSMPALAPRFVPGEVRTEARSVWAIVDAATGARLGPMLVFEAVWDLK